MHHTIFDQDQRLPSEAEKKYADYFGFREFKSIIISPLLNTIDTLLNVTFDSCAQLVA